MKTISLEVGVVSCASAPAFPFGGWDSARHIGLSDRAYQPEVQLEGTMETGWCGSGGVEPMVGWIWGTHRPFQCGSKSGELLPECLP